MQNNEEKNVGAKTHIMFALYKTRLLFDMPVVLLEVNAWNITTLFNSITLFPVMISQHTQMCALGNLGIGLPIGPL